MAVSNAANGDDAGGLHEVGGAKLYAEISGQGPPIVFLHGGLSYFDLAFAQQKVFFSSFRTVIGIDQRGHGQDYARVSPDGERHWPVMVAKTKQLWATWTILEPEDLMTRDFLDRDS